MTARLIPMVEAKLRGDFKGLSEGELAEETGEE